MKLIKNFWISVLFALVLFSGTQYLARGVFADPDGFYHAKASQLLAQGKLTDTFPWLYYTTWNQEYADQHFLYHWFLTPFNTIGKLPWSVVVFGLTFVILFLLILRKQKIGMEVLWTILLLGSSIDFLFRISLIKANTISLALLCIIVLLMQSYHIAESLKTRLLSLGGILFVSGLFVWTYGGFVCVPFLLAAYGAAYFVSEIILKKKRKVSNFMLAGAPFLVSIVGIIIGMFAHPDSGHLATLIYDQLFRTGLGAGLNVPVGNEWQSFDLVWFVQSNILLLVIWLMSVVIVFYRLVKERSNDSTISLWLQFTAIGLMALTLWHRRFVEYWVPFAVLATAFTLWPHIAKVTWEDFKESMRYWQMKFVVLLLFAAVSFTVFYNVSHTVDSLKGGSSPTDLKAASFWLKDNSQAGDIVFDSQWDQFPQMFYWNDKNYYIVGLDPTFMYIHNPDLYWQWRKVADDEEDQWESVSQIHNILSDDFHCKYILIDKTRNPKLDSYIKENDVNQELFTNKFENDNSIVFLVR